MEFLTGHLSCTLSVVVMCVHVPQRDVALIWVSRASESCLCHILSWQQCHKHAAPLVQLPWETCADVEDVLDFSTWVSSNTLLSQGLRGKHSHHGSHSGKCGKRSCTGAEVKLSPSLVFWHPQALLAPWDGGNGWCDKQPSGFLCRYFTV